MSGHMTDAPVRLSFNFREDQVKHVGEYIAPSLRAWMPINCGDSTTDAQLQRAHAMKGCTACSEGLRQSLSPAISLRAAKFVVACIYRDQQQS